MIVRLRIYFLGEFLILLPPGLHRIQPPASLRKRKSRRFSDSKQMVALTNVPLLSTFGSAQESKQLRGLKLTFSFSYRVFLAQIMLGKLSHVSQ